MVAILVIFAPQIIGFFNPKPEVIKYGTLAIRVISSSFPFHGVSAIMMYALRGAGNSKGPFISMLVCMIGVRLSYLYLMTKYVANTPNVVISCFPTGWVIMFFVILVMYIRTDFESKAGLLKTGKK